MPLEGCAGSALVFVGELADVDASPVRTFTPLLGAELRIDPAQTITLRVNPSFEHALLVDAGPVTFEGTSLERGDLGCVDPGLSELTITTGEMPARLILLGGEPFTEEIVMWWNFIGRSHDEVAEAREQYESGSERFGTVEGYTGPVERIPTPQLPPVRLRARNRGGRVEA